MCLLPATAARLSARVSAREREQTSGRVKVQEARVRAHAPATSLLEPRASRVACSSRSHSGSCVTSSPRVPGTRCDSCSQREAEVATQEPMSSGAQVELLGATLSAQTGSRADTSALVDCSIPKTIASTMLTLVACLLAVCATSQVSEVASGHHKTHYCPVD